jgi:hypothetical protein
MDSDSHIYGLLGRIHVLLRRTVNRITDVEYMRFNADYAREIIRVAAATGNQELLELCAKLSVAMDLNVVVAPPAEAPEKAFSFGFASKKNPPEDEGEDRYIRSLR